VALKLLKYGLGVSWDRESKSVDVDLQAIVVDKKGSIIDAVYYNNLKALKAITHSGDETTGDKAGLDEVIWVQLAKLPEHVELIIFVIAAYSGGSLRDATNGMLHVVEERKDAEVARFAMERSEQNVDAVAVMMRSPGGWKLRILDTPAQDGRHFIDILEPTLGNLIREIIPGAPKRQKVAFAMEKGAVFDLPETSSLGQIAACLGWDVSPTAGKDVDLDVSAVFFSKEGKPVGAVFFGNTEEFGFQHSGDNLTGEGDGDDEMIIANLQTVPREVEQIFFVVNVYTQNVTFGQVFNAYCRILDSSNNELARYVLREGKNERGLIIARLFREPGDRWGFQALGKFCRGQTWKDSIRDMQPIVQMSARAVQMRGTTTMSLGSPGPLVGGSSVSVVASASITEASPPPPKSSACAVL